MFKLEIRTGGAAYRMEDDPNPTDLGDGLYENRLDPTSYELRRNLTEVRNQLRGGRTSGSVFDINGNKTGEWSLE